jgi:hypothetical protein
MPPGHQAGACYFSGSAFLFFSFSLFFLPFISIKFCYCFAIYVSVQFSVQVTQGLGVFWTSVFLDYSAR